MVLGEGETSNTLLDTLEDWNSYLKAEDISFSKLTEKPENTRQNHISISSEGMESLSSRSRRPRRKSRGPSL
jgi:hypothetical protein